MKVPMLHWYLGKVIKMNPFALDSSGESDETSKADEYMKTRLDPVLKPMIQAILNERPDDPVNWMIQYLKDEGMRHRSPSPILVNYNKGRRRTGISAESVRVLEQQQNKPPVYPKSDEERHRIREYVHKNIMFTSLDSSQWNVVLDAMQETEFKAGVNIVVQGEEGDFFYVLDSGEAEAYVVKDGNAPYLMKTYSSGESFGELSLMYNSPSGTTITAKTDCKCWALDRISFKNLLKITTGDRQQRYEDFLHRVPILQSLTLLELHRIADAVVEKTFEDGEWIIRQGDIGDRFYIITEGNARVYKTYNDGNSVDLAHLSSGGYFGELALVTDNPRAANVVAVGKLVTVTLDRGAFTRLLGPITDILKRSKEEYENIERRLYNAKMEQMRNSVHLPSQNN